MFLKSLELFGFKSFADHTRIEFSDGISALLGPNGCGKSNVVDAIKWVVGEQSARSLRADTMEDVIFNGTERRKALSVAEVILTISNELGLLPLDMPEVGIKRRLYRSGESEYFINGTLAKLREVRELFWDTGIGKSAYSVMEQGRIDQILSSRPEDRRYLFEEAAGITRHKVRTREAELKLEHTEENMRQVGGILGEVKRSHDSLKTQADKTTAYRKYRDDIFKTEIDLHLVRLRQFLQDKDRRSVDMKSKTSERDSLKHDVDAINAFLSENLDLVTGLETELVDLQKTVYGLAVEKNGKDKQKSLLAGKVSESKSKIAQSELRLRTVKDKIEALRDEEDEKNEELAGLKSRLREVERNIDSFEEGIRVAETTIRGNESEIMRSEAGIGKLEAVRTDARTKLDAITEDIVSELDVKLKDSGYSSRARKEAEEGLNEIFVRLRTLLGGKLDLVSDGLICLDRGTDIRRILERLHEDLIKTISGLDDAEAAFRIYQGTSPSFIDEFLSPEGIMTRKREIDREILECDAGIAERRERIVRLRAENVQLAEKVSVSRKALEDQRGNRIRMQTQASGLEENLIRFRREIASQEIFLRELESEMALEKRRLEDSVEELETLDSEIAEIETKGRKLTSRLEILEKDIASRNSDLGKRRGELSRKTERLSLLSIELERLHLGLAQTETEIRNVKENFAEQYSRELVEFESRMLDIRVPMSELRDRLASLRQGLRDLGSVNLMAVEEFSEVKERYDFLSVQMADLEKAKADLQKITDEIRAESAALFLETYNKIKKNFHNMFRRLFGGGRAELRLLDPDHVLVSGIEILAQPPGKKLEAISLLSGGEKTLTAIALLFATYMVKPSPFCFLDEIDAALDEANVSRFVNLLREFGKSSQFIVITHNKKTVAGADTLLGVTMEESGVTKAISVRLERSGDTTAAMRAEDAVWMDEEVPWEDGRELPPASAPDSRAVPASTAEQSSSFVPVEARKK